MNYSQANNSDEATRLVFSDVLESGASVTAGDGRSVGATKTSTEILGYTFHVTDPCDRLIFSPELKFNLPQALARFIWFIAGNDRLYDIEYYAPNVRKFTDDNIVVPGSSYGRRMRYAKPGLDQLTACIQELKTPGSRRAAISIFFPEDTGRISNDIPCAFGVFFHVRDEKLTMTIMMRSNNAFHLLPYNLFEFSLVGEAVASALNVPFARIIYFCGSMHVYDENRVAAQSLIDAPVTMARNKMPPMPRSEKILEQITLLVRKESELRTAASGLTTSKVDALCKELGKPADLILDGKKTQVTLDPYFQQFYYLLLLYVVKREKIFGVHEKLKRLLDPVYRDFIGDRLDVNPDAGSGSESPWHQFSEEGVDDVVDIADASVEKFFAAIPQAESTLKRTINSHEIATLLRSLKPELLALAARGETDATAFDPNLIIAKLPSL